MIKPKRDGVNYTAIPCHVEYNMWVMIITWKKKLLCLWVYPEKDRKYVIETCLVI